MDLTELYSSRTQQSFREDETEILSILKANPDVKLKVTNYYQGLPISYPATIASINRGVLELRVREEQAYVIGKSRSAFISSPLLKYSVFAQAQYADVRQMSAGFSQFSYVELVAERRNFVRIVPDPLPDVVIDSALGTFHGEVQDVSLTGIGVLMHQNCPLATGNDMPISFVLKSVGQSETIKVNVLARLLSVAGDSLPRTFKFAFTPDKILDEQLSKYIIQRQIEIIKQVKAAVNFSNREP